jgi:hypothetical protein
MSILSFSSLTGVEDIQVKQGFFFFFYKNKNQKNQKIKKIKIKIKEGK